MSGVRLCRFCTKIILTAGVSNFCSRSCEDAHNRELREKQEEKFVAKDVEIDEP